MKIEIGESLIYSWLRHVKKCQIVQMNWKPSPKWQPEEINCLEKMKIEIENEFKDTKLDIFHKNNSIDQLLNQAEIDVVGSSHDSTNDKRLYHFVDVAFHEKGLNYGPKEETISRIMKKNIRAYFLYLSYFNDHAPAVFYFITPKMSKYTLLLPLEENLKRVKEIFHKYELNPDFQIISNDDFNSLILKPTIDITGEIADTNELFLRSVQLCKMFVNEPKQEIKDLTNISQSEISTTGTKGSDKKIGQHVRICLKELFQKNQIDEGLVNNLLSVEYCKKVFNTKFPILRRKDQGRLDDLGYPRYYSDLWRINNEFFFFSSQWYEKQRNYFDKWYHYVLYNK